MLSTIARRHFLSLAMAPVGRLELSLNSMGEMLIFLQMRDSARSPTILAASALHVQCVGLSLEVPLEKHVQTWLHRTGTGTATQWPCWFVPIILFCHHIWHQQVKFLRSQNYVFLSYRFYIMVYAFRAYNGGNLQFFGNVQNVRLDGQCTGRECQTSATSPPPPTPGPPSPPGSARWGVTFYRIIKSYKR